ncbi:MAG: hypothetical protein H8E55_62270 [Pelagibacterales bacterium]|nr:hypothetical protein [Pelagibacterales bacterium]
MPDGDSHKVRCLNMSYDQSSDMITWELYFLEKDRKQVFAYPSQDIKTAVGISGDVNEDDWAVFCKKMINKEFTLVLPIEDSEDVK